MDNQKAPNIMKTLVLLLFTMLTISCFSNIQKYHSENKNPEQKQLHDSTYYLKNRMADCKDKVQYMDTSIIKYSKHIQLYYKKDTAIVNQTLLMSWIKDPKEPKIQTLELYYLDIECLKSMDVNHLLKLFFKNETATAILDKIHLNQHHKIQLLLDFVHANNVVKIYIKNGHVIDIFWLKPIFIDQGLSN